MHYNESLIESGLQTLCARRQAACVKRFDMTINDPNYELVPKSNSSLNYHIRKKNS